MYDYLLEVSQSRTKGVDVDRGDEVARSNGVV